MCVHMVACIYVYFYSMRPKNVSSKFPEKKKQLILFINKIIYKKFDKNHTIITFLEFKK